ncbi:hypothetical protein LguiA_029826 [Lonicera macranthoides]
MAPSFTLSPVSIVFNLHSSSILVCLVQRLVSFDADTTICTEKISIYYISKSSPNADTKKVVSIQPKSQKQHSYLVSVLDCLWARIIAAILWAIHMLAKKTVYSKIHYAIGMSKVSISYDLCTENLLLVNKKENHKPHDSYDTLQAGISGGGSLPSHVDKFFEAIGITIQNGYGLTESSPVLAARHLRCNSMIYCNDPVSSQYDVVRFGQRPARPQPRTCSHGFVFGSSRPASQGVTHPGIALVHYSLNFGVFMESEANENELTSDDDSDNEEPNESDIEDSDEIEEDDNLNDSDHGIDSTNGSSNSDGSSSTDSETSDEEHIRPPEEGGQSTTQSTTKGGRGSARLGDIWGTGKQLEILFNEFFQPIGENSAKLSTHLGIIARDGNRLPLTLKDWRCKDLKPYKERVWLEVKENTGAPEEFKKTCLKKVGKIWNNWKSDVKRDYYRSCKTDEERLQKCPPRVEEDQWPKLVEYWGSREAKKKSRRNRRSRKMQKTPHTSGQKSHATVSHEIEVEKGVKPSRIDVYFKTHERKNGEAIDKGAAEAMSKMKEKLKQLPPESIEYITCKNDIFYEVMGRDSNGHCRTYGVGPSPTDVFGLRQSHISKKEYENLRSEIRAELRLELQSELRNEVRDEIRNEVNDRFSQMENQLEYMRKLMASCSSAGSKEVPKTPDDNMPSQTSHLQPQHELEDSTQFRPSFVRPQINQLSPSPENEHAQSMARELPTPIDEEFIVSSEQNLRLNVDEPLDKQTWLTKKQKKGKSKKDKRQRPSNTGKGYDVDLLSFGIPKNIVAQGFITSKDPLIKVGGVELGKDLCEVYIEKVFMPNEPLPRPYDNMYVVGDACHKTVAWHYYNVTGDI